MHHLTPSQLRQAADLNDKVEALGAELAVLFGGTAPAPVEAPAAVEGTPTPEPVQAEEAAKPGKRAMSLAQKAKIRAVQALRWAKYHAANGHRK
jgi:hypothetical protein